MKSKESTIEVNNRSLDAKEMEINKMKIEMNHLKVKIDSLQKDLKDQEWKTERAQRQAKNAQDDKEKILREMGSRRRNSRSGEKSGQRR